MNSSDALIVESMQTQRALLWALIAAVVVISLPNNFLAAWTSSYAEFWVELFGGRPMKSGTYWICRFHVAYRIIAALLPVAGLVLSFVRLPSARKLHALIVIAFAAALQLLVSLYFLWHAYWITLIQGRGYF